MFHLHSDIVQIHPACSGRASEGEMNVAAFTTNMEHHYANKGEITHLQGAPVKKTPKKPTVSATATRVLHYAYCDLPWDGGGGESSQMGWWDCERFPLWKCMHGS